MIWFSLLALSLNTASAENKSPIVQAVEAEMTRGMKDLQLDEQPKPYWMAANIYDSTYSRAHTTNGVLLSAKDSHYARIRLDVRVGSLEFDNSNMDTFSNGTEMIWLPEEKDPLALRRAIWLGMDEGL